jgi:two-component system, sensor histidine kinase LadS
MKFLTALFLFLCSLNAYDVFIDKTGLLSIDEVVAQKEKFKSRDNLYFGLTDDTVWIKYDLKNPENSQVDRILYFNSFIASVNFYEKTQDGFTVFNSGYKVLAYENIVNSRHIIYHTTLQKGESKTVYIQLQSHTSIVPTITEYGSLYDFYSFAVFDDILVIALLAILIALFLYNSFIYLFTKDRVYLYYILYQFFFILFQLHHTNYSSVIMGSGALFYPLAQLSATLTVIFMLVFFKEVLQVKGLFPRLNKFYTVLITVFIPLLILSFIFEPTLLLIRNALLIPIALLTVTFTLLLAIRKKVVYSGYLLLGWIAPILSTMYTAFHYPFGLPVNTLTSNAMLIATVIEVIIFSIVLALRFQMLKHEIDGKDVLLQLKSKDAQMGEMIGMVAHQWKQPLSSISIGASTNLIQLEMGTSTPDKVKDYLQSAIEYTAYLSDTIDDFRTFFKVDKTFKLTNTSKPILKALNIQKGMLIAHNVSIEKDFHSTKDVAMFPNEITQVILNIIKNSDDNFIEQKILNPKISISTIDTEVDTQIQICDNGTGIPEAVMDEIFEQSFSTKDESLGTGLGLYMSRKIIQEHHQGRLYAKNTDEGVCFVIVIPLQR